MGELVANFNDDSKLLSQDVVKGRPARGMCNSKNTLIEGGSGDAMVLANSKINGLLPLF